ncbi:hypothetical protein ACM55M_11425 [Flavobacterium sp. ZT3R25]
MKLVNTCCTKISNIKPQMKKIYLIGLIILITLLPCSPKKEKQQQRIYYNTYNYKYDDEIINRKAIK